MRPSSVSAHASLICAHATANASLRWHSSLTVWASSPTASDARTNFAPFVRYTARKSACQPCSRGRPVLLRAGERGSGAGSRSLARGEGGGPWLPLRAGRVARRERQCQRGGTEVSAADTGERRGRDAGGRSSAGG